MGTRIRLTRATRAVVRALVHEQECYGLEIIQSTRLASGTVYPILARLERQGCLHSRWETDEVQARGPRRRFYRLTPLGLALARSVAGAGGVERGVGTGGAPVRPALGGAGG
ncbi:hypothetical protein GCM10010174_17250 [Kutzneria viridogrisea]|uniref:Transcription regulator PadR N-terminal domain-containing protein n=2 Tax=Kutzneria TaxID=43356 RepID=W5WNH1_9PSEU|nr:PadR family transcriptional regulator [Kutzneria albida]AHH99699.1 hypothetical protein KALB_6339 [Kutzneria albida DSM 43870]MBA8924875.1 DNA-binding PadR family transcriptional regulator [Kutzneria viridogrisea]